MDNAKTNKNKNDVAYQGLKDFLFESIVRTCNLSDFSVGINVVVGGVVISGDLIGIREYYDEILKLNPESGFFKSIHDLKETSSSIEKITKDSEDGVLANYFHLKNAKFYTVPNNPFPSNGSLWRGKISEVNGFAFGKFEINK